VHALVYSFSDLPDNQIVVAVPITKFINHFAEVAASLCPKLQRWDRLPPRLIKFEKDDSAYFGLSAANLCWHRDRNGTSNNFIVTTPDEAFKAGAIKEIAFLTTYGQDRLLENHPAREIFGYCAQSPSLSRFQPRLVG
jgi:hypothetical protein